MKQENKKKTWDKPYIYYISFDKIKKGHVLFYIKYSANKAEFLSVCVLLPDHSSEHPRYQNIFI